LRPDSYSVFYSGASWWWVARGIDGSVEYVSGYPKERKAKRAARAWLAGKRSTEKIIKRNERKGRS
jgi:hypothetical protein